LSWFNHSLGGQLEEKAKVVGWDKGNLTEQLRKRKTTTIAMKKRIFKVRDI